MPISSAEDNVLKDFIMKVLNIVGARPNFMKIAPIVEEMRKHPDLQGVLVHTGQHYDEGMSDVFFRELGIPVPDVHLGIGSDSHATQTAQIIVEFKKVCLEQKPGMVLVVGDVNSTIGCALRSSSRRARSAYSTAKNGVAQARRRDERRPAWSMPRSTSRT